MRILIGTPIHQIKDYCMEHWLKNVSRLTYPADLFLVDNSPGTDYVKKVEIYCKKTGIKNFKIIHIDLPQNIDYHEKIARAREVIRQYVIDNRYDAWFSWESDQIIPDDSLDKLIKLMDPGNSSPKMQIVSHNNWVRQLPDEPNTDLGIALISAGVLKKYSFILKFGTDPDMPHNWKFGDPWLKMQVFRDGGGFLEVYGLLDPVYHLNNGEAPPGKIAIWEADE